MYYILAPLIFSHILLDNVGQNKFNCLGGKSLKLFCEDVSCYGDELGSFLVCGSSKFPHHTCVSSTTTGFPAVCDVTKNVFLRMALKIRFDVSTAKCFSLWRLM